MKVKWTADYLDIPYTWQDIDVFAGESRTESFLAMNPQGQVPCVELDAGKFLGQSNAIVRYLAAGSQLIPKDLYLQGMMDSWMLWELYSHEPYIAVCRAQMQFQGGVRAARRVEGR